jgi:hypothetical protein
MKKSLAAIFFIGWAGLFAAGPTLAGKPQDVIGMSNGYPSGAHFNLIIHGKDTNTFTCEGVAGGGSLFVADYGRSTIQYISNKKASITELTVQVQLPYDEYYVFARLHGKPKTTAGTPSSVLLTPNPVLQVCNQDPNNPDAFGDYTEFDAALMMLGMVTSTGVYYATPPLIEKTASSTNSKGQAKAQEITNLFTWTGYVCEATLDVNGDGVLDIADVSADQDADGDIDDADLTLFLSSSPTCTYYENEWVFNIADLVIQDQYVDNTGGKTLQIRFYPRSTTQFISNVP